MKTFKELILEVEIRTGNPAATFLTKLLDPTQITSWEDIPPAISNYRSNPSNMNAIYLGLALGSATPLFGKATQMAKRALAVKNTAQAAQIIEPIVADLAKKPGLLTKLGLNNQTITQVQNQVKANVPAAHNQTTSKMFDYNKWITAGGTVGRSNKPTRDGIKQILTYLQIPFKDEQLNSQGIKQIFTNVQNKQKLQNFLNNNPIEVKYFPDSYAEIKDGNHRFELAILAGITNFLTK